MARFGAIKTTFCGLACCGAMANAYAALGNGPFEIGTGVLQEELSWLQAESTIFSASRHEEKVSRTAAAVLVLSQDDIRRSGATSIPDALRLVPGLDVAQINANSWAISARGFNDRSANKMLVLMDGRTLYHPVFSGTLWHTKDTLLEDVERIEVIRGPGAAMWGSNAVNGVINIITRSAKDSSGLYATAGTGTEENGFGAVRYGGQLGEQTYYKGYVKYLSRDAFALAGGGNANDAWETTQGGFKVESAPSKEDSLTLQGDIYQGNSNALQHVSAPQLPFEFDSTAPKRYSGGNVLGRWGHRFSDTSDMTLKLYFDHTEDTSRFPAIDDATTSRVDTYDADWQHHFQWGDAHAWTWGLGYRYTHMRSATGKDFFFAMRASTRDTQLFSGFVQDEITLVPDRWRVILGTRIEHNDFSGFEVQPNGRLVFTPTDNQTVWASISRAVRIPNRLDHDMQATYLAQVSPGIFLVGQGNPDFKPEELVAYELGYRIQPTSSTSVDIATFYNDYSRLTSASLGTPFLSASPSLHGVLPIFPENDMRGQTYGAEVMGQWRVAPDLRLQANYTYLQIQLSGAPLFQQRTEDSSPHHQFSIRTSYDLTESLQADAILRYVDKLPAFEVDSYAALDLRLGWKPTRNLELAVVGRNLLDGQHPEFGESVLTAQAVEIQRSVYGQISLRY